MINFKKVELQDKAWVDPLLRAADFGSCHQSFTNLFAWVNIYCYRIAQVENHLVVKGTITNDSGEATPYYFFPAGGGDPQKVLEEMKKDADDAGHPFVLYGLSPENVTDMKRIFPEKFEFKETQESFDYVYLLEKLVTLSGKKLSAKRNHINRFKENNDWTFEPITMDNIEECWEMNVQWCRLNGCLEDQHLSDEYCAVRRCYKYFQELSLEGGLIRSAGRVIAYTMGGQLNSNTFDINVEKAFGEIQGAYQMINREFAALIQEKHPQILYVNREEDMGYPGLRKAKLSYYPVKFEEKYLGRYIN
ncbi:DUF2156 domain-containing protein [Dehalobacterium formicoaceticum]|uniref:DUF2156 domain-containing protein n=1 Tax=Dehalobacterium formicoaceticum TaxID=51515 RepID=UPI000B7C5DF2|nr:phosphatidylglycerol lysyltransferase domain-containing protein [Dehalobacterium formicoaceticum]